MRKARCLVAALAFGLLGWAQQGTTPAKKKSVAKKSTQSTATPQKSSAAGTTKTGTTHKTVRKSTSVSTGSRSASSRRGKKGPVRRTTWRNRQLAPSADRYKQIQQALSAKGYLPPDAANGQWNEASAAALKKFQADQNLDASGKINSLSLIALGLGPKRETASSPAAPSPAAPPAAGPVDR